MENEIKKKSMLSGIQPSGDLHLGNYLGAVKNWGARADEFDCYYFMADLHTLTCCAAAASSSLPSTLPAALTRRRTSCSCKAMFTSMRSLAGYSTATPCSASSAA